MDLYKMAEEVDSKESFLQFVQALAADAGADRVSGGWENGSAATFLDAMSAWAYSRSGITGTPMISEQASWRAFAEMLHAGKFYE